MTALEKLLKKMNDDFHVCVGLDTDIEKIPNHLRSQENGILEFNKIVIENTYKTAAAYKINFAFYEKYGSKGWDIISKTLELIPKDILTIADAKRGDIGNTSKMYAQSIFEYLNFDSITLHPYMGFDSLNPFLEFNSKLNFILALTSNPGSADFEKQKLENGNYLYQEVLGKIQTWNRSNNCGIVFGATNADELKFNISAFGKLPVLLPGVGAQGGSLEEVVKIFYSNGNNNFLINVSRALLYADSSTSLGQTMTRIMTEYNSTIKLMKR
jgi:orotidine-5'-phosphate decarboxylase